jgi:hypothetical protein
MWVHLWSRAEINPTNKCRKICAKFQAVGGKAVDPTAVKEGKLTGTNKDLRRLSMIESKTLLLKLGLTEDEIKGTPPPPNTHIHTLPQNLSNAIERLVIKG